MKGQIAYLPGGRNRILFGGTRNKIVLSRPWQMSLEGFVKPENCPFCTKPQDELPLPKGSPYGWKLLPNIFTPHMDHSLIIPDRCWEVGTLQRWGGVERISEAMLIAVFEARASNEEREIVLLVNVGMNAGQSLSHAHMHTFRSFAERPLKPEDLLGYANNPDIKVFDSEDWIVVAGGVKVGECIIIPRKAFYHCSYEAVRSLACAISRLIDLSNEKFRSTESLCPSYSFIVRIFQAGGNVIFRYADYCPILDTWGNLQYAASALEGEPFVVRWPPMTTAAYLRG